MKQQTITGQVAKVGRKWLHIVQTGKNEKYPEQLLKNELVNELKVGDTFELFVQSEGEKTYTGAWKWIHTATTKENIKKEKKENDINKWWGYIQKSYKEGRIYYNGIAELHKLNFHDFDEEIEEMKKEIEVENAIYWIRKNAKENRLYKNGLETLKKYNCNDYEEEISEIRANIKAIKEVECAKYETFGFECEYGMGNPQKGEILVRNNKAWKIKSISKQVDGMSFGYWTDYWWACDCIDISETEEGIQELKKYEVETEIRTEIKLFKINKLNPAKKELSEMKDILIEKIKLNDILKGKKETYPSQDEITEILFDDINIYGGGKSIFIKDNKIWNFINNGNDGAMWSINHISTWGAGGYGEIATVDSVSQYIKDYKLAKETLEILEFEFKNNYN